MGTPLIEIRGFSKSFGNKHVHENLDFTLFEGEVVSLLGGSGSGKSVLLRAMIGLESPDSGKIFFKGQDVTDFREEEWCEVRKSIAYAFQGGALFDSFTIEENLLFPLEEHTKSTRKEKQKIVDETLALLGLSGTQHLLPADLSGGMQKRAGLARALILGPEIILYDEPTAGLDPFNTRKIQEIIKDLREKGTSGVLVTHDMPTAVATSQRIELLMNGSIAARGSVEEMRHHPLVNSFMTGEIAYGKT